MEIIIPDSRLEMPELLERDPRLTLSAPVSIDRELPITRDLEGFYPLSPSQPLQNVCNGESLVEYGSAADSGFAAELGIFGYSSEHTNADNHIGDPRTPIHSASGRSISVSAWVISRDYAVWRTEPPLVFKFRQLSENGYGITRSGETPTVNAWQLVLSTPAVSALELISATFDNTAFKPELDFITFVWDKNATDGTAYLYVNGVEVISDTRAGWANTETWSDVEHFKIAGSEFSSGTPVEDSNQQWDGVIKEVGVWGRALSPVEVLELYRAPKHFLVPA